MIRRRYAAALGGLLFALAVPLACDTGGIVGGECAKGLTLCDGKCVDLGADEGHCGECDSVCAAGVACVGGVCGGEGGVNPDAGDAGDAAIDVQFPDRPDVILPEDGGDAGDAPITDGGGDVSIDAPGDGSTGDGSTGDGMTGDACVPPFDRPDQCGDCFTQCVNPNPICAPVDGSFGCVPLCAPPLVNCGGSCVDTNSDPNHCGMCLRACPTGLCQGGTCVGATVGHKVLFCTDFDRPVETSPQTTLLANGVFLTTRNPARILAYDEHADSSNKARVNQALDFAASEKGRSFTIDDASTTGDVIMMLSIQDYEVFLVYNQPDAPAGALGTVGSMLAATLDAFARAGGTVVTLTSDQGADEMPNLLTSAGLLTVTDVTNVTFSVIHNRSPADAVGLNVPTPFLALQETCTFTTSEAPAADNVFVVTDTDPTAGTLGSPVVIHKTQLP